MPSLLQNLDLWDILIRVFVLLTAMPVHEYAHASMAVRLGDDTPIKQGRYTLNPFAHLSLIGSIALLFLSFGWAKPVQIDMRNLRRPKRDMAIIAFMGPLSNILMALVVLIAEKILLGFMPDIRSSLRVYMTYVILESIISINIMLAVFNLLPFAPLDGSKIIGAFVPARFLYDLRKYEGIISVVLLLLLYTGYLFTPINYISSWIMRFLNFITIPVDRIVGLTLA